MNRTNKNCGLPFATDTECKELRQKLINSGNIVPVKSKARRINIYNIPEEGVYKFKRIRTDEEYNKRRDNYFTMLQSILKSRIELGVEFTDENEDNSTKE